ncbi:hypothetical protein CYMTET_3499 [Cymbomonas tetramitiformis]|uniref:Uncharacterized protein n=1 Tax=Cymbomonas tetramitiformis TaxID=36881 RepID=A0AAE0H362_9CHLO|nr:hypothetical protein CYMTET_3499 [Cymbomonas tetramitiformis]
MTTPPEKKTNGNNSSVRISIVALLLSLVACVGVTIFVVIALSSDVFKGDRGAKGERGIDGKRGESPGSPEPLESIAVVHLDTTARNNTERSDQIFKDGVRQVRSSRVSKPANLTKPARASLANFQQVSRHAAQMTSELREHVRRLTAELQSVKSDIREVGEKRDRPIDTDWRDAFDARLLVAEHDRAAHDGNIERVERQAVSLTAMVQELRDDANSIFISSTPTPPDAVPSVIEIAGSDDDVANAGDASRVASQDRETVALIRNQLLPRINNDLRLIRFQLHSQASAMTMITRERDEENAKFQAELQKLQHKIYNLSVTDDHFDRISRQNAGDENTDAFYGLTVDD